MFIPHTQKERETMLHAIGVNNMEALFQAVPTAHRFPKLDLPPGLTEMEAWEEIRALASSNESADDLICFLGAGAYNHYIPAAVDAVLRRSEFYTAYTPYQPEISQGTLQGIFEYQSLISSLTGMDTVNASHYDGATALAEAVKTAYAVFRGKRKQVVLSPAIHPQYRATAHTYTQGGTISFVGEDIPLQADPSALMEHINSDTALVLVQYPDFFGRIYDYAALAETVHQQGALFGVAVNPLALGLLKPPGEFGADIVVGEGQPLGIPLSFGGPYLGIFATRKKYARKMAGRVVGETTDDRGQRAYVLTLTAREQHIRRERATSNICSNQGLLTLAAATYLALLGKNGLEKVCTLNLNKAHYAAQRLAELPGYALAFPDTPFFNEFVLRCPRPVSEINQHLLDHNILGGYDLEQDYPELANHMLIAVTEKVDRAEIDYLAEMLMEASHD